MTTYKMTEYRKDSEPRVTNWTTRLFAIDTARAILHGQGVPSDLSEHPHITIIAADPRVEAIGTSVFTLVETTK